MSDDFLAQIRAAPDDDALRLVYADYLLERDDPRGELIHLQCTRPDDPRCERLARQLALRWFGLTVTYRRGFVHAIAGTPTALVAQRDVFAHELVREVHVEPANDMRPLYQLPELATVEMLVVREGERERFGDHEARQLAECPHLAGLRSLEVHTNRLGPKGMRALATAAWADRLHALVVENNPIADGQAFSGVRLDGLRILELAGCAVGGGGDTLAAAVPNVEALRLPQNQISGARIGSLGPLPALAELVLDGNLLRPEGMAALGALAGSPALRRLSLVNAWISSDAIAAFAAGPLARGLVELDLHSNFIDDNGAITIGRSFPALRVLDLETNPISADGMRALAEGLPALETLRLGATPGTTFDEVRAIFAHRWVAVTRSST